MASGTWTSVATSGLWSLATNWSGSIIADGSSSTASFTSNITATTSIDTTIGGGWSGTIGNLTFSDSGANGFAWTLGTQSTITLGSLSTITTTTAATINGILAGGAAGLTKAGAQTLTLAGANTFSGSISVNEGTLSVTTSASALGADTARALTVGSGNALSLGIATTRSSFNTQISGTGVLGVNPTGNGAIIIANTGTNNLGVITLNASSSIRASSSGTLAGTITVNTGLALTLQAPSGITGTVSAPIGGLGGLVVGGDAAAVTQTGTVTLSSLTNSYSGNTAVSTGTMTVSGLLGSGSYAGGISIASGATFSFSSSSNQTLSGVISGLGTLTKVTGTSSILTLSGTNSYSALNIQAGTVSVASIANNVGSGVSAINVGLTGTTGTLRYTGSGDTTDRVIYLAGNTTGGATIENNGSGVLVFTSAITGVSATGTRTLTLSGSNAGVNDFQGIIANVGGGAGLTAFTKAGVGYWKLTNVNTFTGNVSVTGGRLEIPALTALGSGTKTISISNTNRNGSMLLSGAVTYPATLSWSLSSGGVDQTNNPLGAIRALANSTIAGAVTIAGTSTVYADTGDLTFNGAISGTSTFFQTRAALGRTVTISGGFGNAATALGVVGPGTTVWTGSVSNTTTTSPNIAGGTLKMVTTTSTATPPVQFAFTGVTLGGTASQTNQISSRYQYTGGTLELSNSGATGAVDYTGLTSTSAINLSRGSGKLKLSRDAAQNFTVRLGNNTSNTPGSGVLTLEYGGTTGTIGTDSSIIFSALGPNAAYARIIISDGAGSFVPAYFDASRVAVPMVYGSAQSNVAAPQAGGTTLTLLSTAFGNYNLTGDITAQATASTSTLRLATSVGTPITLAAGANLQSVFLMDMGTGTARTIVAGASGAKLSRSTSASASGTIGIWTENVTSTGATISADVDARYNAAFTKAGVGILSFTGAVANLSGINIAEGTFRIGSAPATFDSTFGNITLGNVYAASGTTVAAEFNQTGDVVVAGLSGGGANTTLALTGGDLVLTNGAGTGTTGVFGGNISLSGSQKLKVRSLAPSPEGTTQAFQGEFPFTTIEMSRGQISLDPQYGATVTGTPSVTVTGSARVDIQAQNPLEADYTVTFGALTVSAGGLRVNLSNVTASTNPYATRLAASSLTVTGESVVSLQGQQANGQMTFTLPSILSAGPIAAAGRTDGVNVWNGSNIAYYRLAGQALTGGGVAPAGGAIDQPNYNGTETNYPASKGAGASFTSAATDNINVSGAQSAQTTQTMTSLRMIANITMLNANAKILTDAILTSAGVTLGLTTPGKLSTQTGNLYVNTVGGALTIASTIENNGGTATKLILYSGNPITLSGTNSYSGGTFMQGGGNIVTLSGASPLGTGPITGNGGAGFTIASGTFTFGATNTITLNDGGLRLDASTGAAYVLNGAISGTGDLYLTGAGTFTLGAVGTGTGALRMSSSSTVTVNAAQAFTEYDFNNSSLTFRYGTGYTTDISSFITKRPGNTYRIDTNGQSVAWASSVGNGSTYIKTGTGTHTLGAENFFASATVSTGTVSAGNVAALGYGNVTLSAGTTLQTLTTGGQNGKLTITGTLTNSAGGTIRIGG